MKKRRIRKTQLDARCGIVGCANGTQTLSPDRTVFSLKELDGTDQLK